MPDKPAAAASLVISGGQNADLAAYLMRHHKVVSGALLPVWCLPPGAESPEDALVFRADVWPEEMLRHWLIHEGLAPALDTRDVRKAILAASGGAPRRIMALKPVLQGLLTSSAATRARALAEWRDCHPLTIPDLSLAVPEVAALRTLVDLGENPVDRTDLMELCHGLESRMLDRLVALALLSCAGPDEGQVQLTALGKLAADARPA